MRHFPISEFEISGPVAIDLTTDADVLKGNMFVIQKKSLDIIFEDTDARRFSTFEHSDRPSLLRADE